LAETNYDQKLRDLPSILVALLCLRHPDNLKEIVWATLRNKTFDRIWTRRFNLAVRIIDDSSRWDASQPTSLVERATLFDFRVAVIACNQGGAAARGHSQA
jgi:hypothetical protein